MDVNNIHNIKKNALKPSRQAQMRIRKSAIETRFIVIRQPMPMVKSLRPCPSDSEVELRIVLYIKENLLHIYL